MPLITINEYKIVVVICFSAGWCHAILLWVLIGVISDVV
jgi:hypothetical protein